MTPSAGSPRVLTATVSNGALELAEPLDWPSGTRVRLVAWSGDTPPLAARIELRLGARLALRWKDKEITGIQAHIAALRRSIHAAWGVRLPPVGIVDDPGLPDHGWSLRRDGHPVADGALDPERVMLLAPDGAALPEAGLPGTDPTFGDPVRWVAATEAGAWGDAGMTVVAPATVLMVAFEHACLCEKQELFGFEQLSVLLAATSPPLVQALGERGVGQVRLLRLLRHLLGENRSIAAFEAVLERALLEHDRLGAPEGPGGDAAWFAAVAALTPRGAG